MTVIMVLASLLVFTACDKPNANNNTSVQVEQTKGTVVSNVLAAKIGDFVFDEEGRKYVKITNVGEKNAEGIYKSEVWERIDPIDKKRWYTPALNSLVWTNQPVRFNSLFRMEGEEYPVF